MGMMTAVDAFLSIYIQWKKKKKEKKKRIVACRPGGLPVCYNVSTLSKIHVLYLF